MKTNLKILVLAALAIQNFYSYKAQALEDLSTTSAKGSCTQTTTAVTLEFQTREDGKQNLIVKSKDGTIIATHNNYVAMDCTRSTQDGELMICKQNRGDGHKYKLLNGKAGLQWAKADQEFTVGNEIQYPNLACKIDELMQRLSIPVTDQMDANENLVTTDGDPSIE